MQHRITDLPNNPHRWANLPQRDTVHPPGATAHSRHERCTQILCEREGSLRRFKKGADIQYAGWQDTMTDLVHKKDQGNND